MVLITSLLCSCTHNVKLPYVRRETMFLLKASALYIDDGDRLQHVITSLFDPTAIVRCVALETLCDILPLVRDFPPSDAIIFLEYILHFLSMFLADTKESVRICHASNLAKLTLTANGFLLHSIRLSDLGILDELCSPRKLLILPSQASGKSKIINTVVQNVQLAQLRKSIAKVVQELVMSPKQTPNIRRALMQDISKLC